MSLSHMQVYVCVYDITYGECACGGQRTTCGTLFFPSAVWIPGMELGSIGRLASEHLHLLNQHPANGCFLFAFLTD